jgi:hypothetical protein
MSLPHPLSSISVEAGKIIYDSMRILMINNLSLLANFIHPKNPWMCPDLHEVLIIREEPSTFVGARAGVHAVIGESTQITLIQLHLHLREPY